MSAAHPAPALPSRRRPACGDGRLGRACCGAAAGSARASPPGCSPPAPARHTRALSPLYANQSKCWGSAQQAQLQSQSRQTWGDPLHTYAVRTS